MGAGRTKLKEIDSAILGDGFTTISSSTSA